MHKQKISFRLPKDLKEDDLTTAFELSNSIGISYFEAQMPNIDFNPYCQEEVKLLQPGLKIIFYKDSEIVFVMPIKTGNSTKKLHKSINDAFSLNKFLGKNPVISIINDKLTISESE